MGVISVIDASATAEAAADSSDPDSDQRGVRSGTNSTTRQ